MSLRTSVSLAVAAVVAAQPATPQPGQIPSLNYASDEKDNKKIARYRAMLTKNPNDRRAQQALQRLSVQP